MEVKFKESTQALAIKSPVHEAEYGMMENTTLSLYDCLIPKIDQKT